MSISVSRSRRIASHARAIVAEYAEKLGERWGSVPYGPCDGCKYEPEQMAPIRRGGGVSAFEATLARATELGVREEDLVASVERTIGGTFCVSVYYTPSAIAAAATGPPERAARIAALNDLFDRMADEW